MDTLKCIFFCDTIIIITTVGIILYLKLSCEQVDEQVKIS